MSEEAKKAAIEKAMNGFSSHEEAYTAFCRRNNGLGDWNSHKEGYESGFGDGYDAHASHTAAIREKAEALVAVNPVSVYRDKIVEYICEDDFDFTKILEEVEHEGEKYCDISQDGAFALVDYFLNLMEKVNEWRSEDAGQNYDFLHGKAELEKGNV